MPPTVVRSAWPWFGARLITLLLTFALGWQVVNLGAGLWAAHADRLVGQVAPYVSQPDPDALSPLLALGEPDAPMQVVLACDVAQQGCRKKLALLTHWQSSKSVALGHLGEDPATLRRLVFLPRPESDATMVGALTWLALHAQGLDWPHVEEFAKDSQRWDASWSGAVRGVEVDAARLALVRDDADTLLTALIARTMANALEVPQESGVLASGLPVPATSAEGEPLLQELHRAEMALGAFMDALDGDVAPAQARLLAGLPERQRQRYVQWILVGEKVHLFAEPTESEDGSADDDWQDEELLEEDEEP